LSSSVIALLVVDFTAFLLPLQAMIKHRRERVNSQRIDFIIYIFEA